MSLDHLKGCAFGRTARCTCMYLMQWDENAPTRRPLGSRNKEDITELPGGWRIPASQAPEPITVQLTANGETSLREFRPLAELEEERQGPGVSAEYLFAELDQMRAELTDDQALEISRNLTADRCEMHPYSWHFTQGPHASSCAGHEELMAQTFGFSELWHHPKAMVRYAASVSNKLVKEAKAREDEARRLTKHWRDKAKTWQSMAVWFAVVGGLTTATAWIYIALKGWW